ncbi:MAG: hypothetical protein HQ518_29700 [Rhodopirellula sp.]|nr:hypothetical protein [Rhodopirellula sp.]
MRNLRIADPDFEARAHSCLGDCLIQINTKADIRPTELPDSAPIGWHEQWSAGSEQISSRLALIEAELDRLAAVGPEQPQLSVFDSEVESY